MEYITNEVVDADLEHITPRISKNGIIDIFIAYDLVLIRNFGSDMFYVEMVDGEPLLPMNTRNGYPPGIERLFDLMTKDSIIMLEFKNERLLKYYLPVGPDSL